MGALALPRFCRHRSLLGFLVHLHLFDEMTWNFDGDSRILPVCLGFVCQTWIQVHTPIGRGGLEGSPGMEAEWTLQTFSCSGKSICRDVWREPKMLLQLWDVACLCIARTGAKHTSYWRVTQRRCCHGQELRATCKWMSIPFAIPLRIFRIFRIHSSTAQVPAHRVWLDLHRRKSCLRGESFSWDLSDLGVRFEGFCAFVSVIFRIFNSVSLLVHVFMFAHDQLPMQLCVRQRQWNWICYCAFRWPRRTWVHQGLPYWFDLVPLRPPRKLESSHTATMLLSYISISYIILWCKRMQSNALMKALLVWTLWLFCAASFWWHNWNEMTYNSFLSFDCCPTTEGNHRMGHGRDQFGEDTLVLLNHVFTDMTEALKGGEPQWRCAIDLCFQR